MATQGVIELWNDFISENIVNRLGADYVEDEKRA